jgi:LacI family transcriptional regulator
MTLTETLSRRTGRRRRHGAVTIREVAACAGVSVATVSRALNHKQLVRPETSRQVLEAARSLRYVPNSAARSLSIRRSQTVGILLPDVHGEFFSEVIRGIDAAARSSRYHILVSGWHSDLDEMVEVVRAMHGRVDGLIVMAPDLTVSALREQLTHKLPLVLLNSADQRHDAVTIDNYGGAQAMMRHLMAMGHVRIAFIKGPPHNMDARERLRGYRQAMRRLGIGPTRELELEGDFSERSGCQAAYEALALVPRPTAIFAANDSMAVGAISVLAAAGLDVPGAMAVVGFDDIPIARYINPSLTTIRIDIADLGRRAFQLLLDAMARPGAHGVRRDLIRTSLVVRKSCGGLNYEQEATASKAV